MITIKRTSSNNKDFEKLAIALDAHLAILDGDDHAFYSQFNKSSLLKNAIIVYENECPIAIGGYKEYDFETAEIKRMYTQPEHRGKGVATKILSELEAWAKEENYKSVLLETGYLQLDAIALYKKQNYKTIDNYGQYKGIKTSICMKKKI